MPAKTKLSGDIAVIDIGSNSVRLVIYRFKKGSHKPVFETKATCGLARGMLHERPKLDRKGVTLTLKELRKIGRILKKRKPGKVLAIGTAAMRAVASTKAGRKFHQKAERALGHKIAVISGRKEARLTAQGVMSALPKANGICGDLGGGSLEIAAIERGRVGHTATLALGSLTLVSESRGNPIKAEAIMRERLNHITWFHKAKGKTFYPIGGSWRAVARVMMKKLGRRPRRVHGFTINAKLAKKYAENIARQKPAKFHRMHKKIRHRADVIPYAAAVLAEIIAGMKPAKITFSGHGVREGLVQQDN